MNHRYRLTQVFKWPARLVLVLSLLLLGPLAVLGFGDLDLATHWSEASMASSGQAPTPQAHPEALVLVYGARAYNWRGAFGIHTWIAAKRKNADHYQVYQVIGWNRYRGRSVVTSSRHSQPDFHWYNAKPELLLERRGVAAEELIPLIEEAVADYPYPDDYRVWPGPNSNTFTGFVARQVPQLGLDLPPTAIGKDYLPDGRVFDRMPSGSGWQASLFGLLGAGVAREEGVEFNLLGLSFGLDFDDLALRLPGLGRLQLGPQG